MLLEPASRLLARSADSRLSRRAFLRQVAATGGVTAAVSACADSPSAPRLRDTMAFTFPETHFSVLYPGDVATASSDISRIERFEPLFAADRPVVNPTLPTRLDRRSLRFDVPGEYYL